MTEMVQLQTKEKEERDRDRNNNKKSILSLPTYLMQDFDKNPSQDNINIIDLLLWFSDSHAIFTVNPLPINDTKETLLIFFLVWVLLVKVKFTKVLFFYLFLVIFTFPFYYVSSITLLCYLVLPQNVKP